MHNFDSGLDQHQVAASCQVDCIDQNRNIPGSNQLQILEQRNPSMKSKLWNPWTATELKTRWKIIDSVRLGLL